VILNRVRGDRHEQLLREALDLVGIPVVGAVARRDDLVWRDRHLGLVPVVEHVDAARRSIEHLGQVVAAACDLESVRRIAASAPRCVVGPAPTAERVADARVGVARGPAFDFVYPENLELLEEAGAELAPFDPLVDSALPEGIDALYVGGGFPEVFVAGLAENRQLIDDVRTRVDAGLVTWAECGGYLWLCTSLDGVPMAGALPAEATMTERLTLGYRTATPRVDTPVAVAGVSLRGHEFHYSTVDPPGAALDLDARFARERGGFGSETLLASYLHLHLSGAPQVAERFVRCAASSRAARRQ
jgi:cobyrinic acid a,c-diamide synthase